MGLVDRLIARDTRDDDLDQLTRRLSIIPSADMPLWVDNVLTQTGRSIRRYLRDADPADLEEAKMGAESLRALIEEMEKRMNG